MESLGITETRRVPVPRNEEPEQLLFWEVGNQFYKVLEQNGSSSQVLDSESVRVES